MYFERALKNEIGFNFDIKITAYKAVKNRMKTFSSYYCYIKAKDLALTHNNDTVRQS